jgi:hypothetical protein
MVSGLIRNQSTDPKKLGKSDDFSEGAVNAQWICPDLAAVAAAWPTLSPAMRAAIMALVNAASG